MEYTPSTPQIGLNLDSTATQIAPGQVSYALNAQVENFNGEQVTYQNEQANTFCIEFPEGFQVIGSHNLVDKGYVVFFLVNPSNNRSEIGRVFHDSCIYETLINANCLNFNVNFPIHKAVHRSQDCGTEIFWTDNYNPRRFLNLDELPFKQIEICPEPVYSEEVDCNKLLVQPNFHIPELIVETVDGDGTLKAGTYQFAIQYASPNGDGYTSYYTVTNPTPIYDRNKITLDFDYEVNKSITVKIRNLDTTGYFDHFNLAVVKTINNISTVDLVGTFSITDDEATIVYSGQGVSERLTINDIFEKFPIYEKANDLTTVQDTLVWADLTTDERINYQSIANQIKLNWQTWKIDGRETYKNPLNATYLRGYMRDEIYPYEVVFLLKNGKQTDGFHIPGRSSTPADLTPIYNNDVVNDSPNNCDPEPQPLPTWQVYNTGSIIGFEQVYTDFTQGITYPCPKCPPIVSTDPQKEECYVGPYQYGEFSYWESTDVYPCTPIWGELANQPIRHHRFPDSLITHIHDNQGFIYPIGVRINVQDVLNLIQNSNLTEKQKENIQGFKIVRGNRVNNKSVIAKGLIHNVGKYERDEQSYFFPNYPYNDLNQDPFISSESNAPNTDQTSPNNEGIVCYNYQVTAGVLPAIVNYTDCDGVNQIEVVDATEVTTICSRTVPTAAASITVLQMGICSISLDEGSPDEYNPTYLSGFGTDSRRRFTFHSPDTHFFQPTLGNILKLETAEFGLSKGHFREVKNHSKYKFISGNAFITALAIGVAVGFASATIGVSTNAFNGTAAFTAYTSFIQIIDKVIPRKNFAYQYNSVGNYDDFRAVPNAGNKQRRLDIANYMSPGMINIGDTETINNYQRESSVYLRTTNPLPATHTIGGVPEDVSRWVLSDEDCNLDATVEKDISSYYAAIKRRIANQYGQIYSYETIDTGFQYIGDIFAPVPEVSNIQSIFGGDIFINKFAYKSKLPFFIDNRVSHGNLTFPDDSDVFYNELGNVGNPNYWFSTDANEGDFRILGINLGPLFGVKAYNFDCDNSKFFYNSGKIYLFAYGIPYFYCESEVNVDLRQAFNQSEGDFYPRVSSEIPDDWFQEINTTIQQDNSYHYNKTYSKQNKENLFTHIPHDFDVECEQFKPFRAIFSEQNDWFVYRPVAKYDFPENYGKLTSLEGIENRVVLARFDNKSLLYNVLLTAPTSAADVYLGQSLFNSSVPPLDFAETDIGYAGSQHKIFLKTEYGHISTDSRRGQVFLYKGQQVEDISNKWVSKFFAENLPFVISKSLPDVPTDNHFNGIGLHGVHDSYYNRFILTKLDYEPKFSDIRYENFKFYRGNKQVQLTDKEYFFDRSFTMSYDFDNQAWISFHTYLPNFYVPETNFFYSGTKKSLWKHNVSHTKFIEFYGEQAPYTIEYPYHYKFQDEILQSVKDYSKFYQFLNEEIFIEPDDCYFNKLIIYTPQQCSGNLTLVKKPKNKLSEYNKYPVYHSDNKEVLYTKSDNFYQVNTFWDMVKSVQTPIWNKSTENLSFVKELNQSNLDYSKRSFKKGPIRGKNIRLRFTLDNRTDTKSIQQFAVTSTVKSFK